MIGKAYKRTYLIVFLVLLLCLLSFMVESTLAYLADGDTALNIFDIGSVSSKVEEEFVEPGPPYPGMVIAKKVSIENNGPCDCYVRVQVLFSEGDMEECCQINFNTDSWEYKNEWWYYKAPISPGEMTEELFSEIHIDEEADENNMHPFDVIVRQESWQSSGYDNCFAPWI